MSRRVELAHVVSAALLALVLWLGISQIPIQHTVDIGGADAAYVGQSTNGVAKITQGGRVISFYPLQANTNVSLAPTMTLTSSNLLTLGTSCGDFKVAPAIANLTSFGAIVNAMGLQANINAQGVGTIQAGATVYAFRPDFIVTSGAAGKASLTQGADKLYRFTDNAGNVQILNPAFVDVDGLISQVHVALGQFGTVVIQLDGTALFTTNNGKQFVLTPDLTLTAASPANAAKLWWQDAPNHYLVRGSTLTLAQGFTVQAK